MTCKHEIGPVPCFENEKFSCLKYIVPSVFRKVCCYVLYKSHTCPVYDNGILHVFLTTYFEGNKKAVMKNLQGFDIKC